MMIRKTAFIASLFGVFAAWTFAETVITRIENITATGAYGFYNCPPSVTVDRSGLQNNPDNPQFPLHQNVAKEPSTNQWLMTQLWLSTFKGGTLSTPSPLYGRNCLGYLIYTFDQVYELGELVVWNYNEANETDRGYKTVMIHYIPDALGDPANPADWLEFTGPGEGGTWQFNEANGENDYGANTFIPFVSGPAQPGLQAKVVMITCLETWGDSAWSGLSEVQFNLIHDCIRKVSSSDLNSDNAVDGDDLNLLCAAWLSDGFAFSDPNSGRVAPERLRAYGPSTDHPEHNWDLGPIHAIDRSGLSPIDIPDPENPGGFITVYEHGTSDTSAMWMSSNSSPMNADFPHPLGFPSNYEFGSDPNLSDTWMAWIQIDFVDDIGELITVGVKEMAAWNFNGSSNASDWLGRNIEKATIHYLSDGDITDPNDWTQYVGPNADGTFTFEPASGDFDYLANTFISFGDPETGIPMKSILITAYSQYGGSEWVGLSEIEFYGDVPQVRSCPVLPAYDFNENCRVDLGDFGIWAAGWLNAWIYSENCTLF